MKHVTIMGAGAIGATMAGLLSDRGFSVTLYNRPEHADTFLEPIREAGGVTVEANGTETFTPIFRLTTDMEAAMKDAELVLIMSQAASQRAYAKLMAPFVRDDHVIVVCCGVGGVLEYPVIWKKLGVSAKPLLGETQTMPISARVVGKAQYVRRLPCSVRTAAFPGKRTAELCRILEGIIDTVPVESILDEAINCGNTVVHPLPMVLNYAEIERQNRMFSIMNEGMTDCVLKALDGFDAERMKIGDYLGVPRMTIDEIYSGCGVDPGVYRKKGEPMKMKKKDHTHMRFIDDDVPYGSMFLETLADMFGIDVPIIKATNTLAVLVSGKDYRADARTAETLGIAGMTLKQLHDYLRDGEAT